MFRFTSPDLPVKPSQLVIAPAFKIWQGDRRGMGVFVRFNLYPDNLYFQPIQASIPEPTFTGCYTRIDLGLPILDPSVLGFDCILDAVELLPYKFWVDGTTLNFYSPQPLTSPIAINLTVSEFVPLTSSDYVWQVEIPEGMTAVSARSEGLTCAFTQLDNILTITGSPQSNLRVGDEILVSGIVSATVPTTTLSVATFHFPEMEFLDRLEWMGKIFSAAQDALNPKVNEFVWHDHYCTIFTDINLGGFSNGDRANTTSFTGSITYNRPTF